jgi:phage gp46-like protein
LSAKQITAVRTRHVKDAEEVTHLAEANHDAGLQWLTVREVVQAIEQGERYFIQIGSESLLLSVQKPGDGRKTVGVGFEPGSGRLLTLPRG